MFSINVAADTVLFFLYHADNSNNNSLQIALSADNIIFPLAAAPEDARFLPAVTS
jgi:hypothetical protein